MTRLYCCICRSNEDCKITYSDFEDYVARATLYDAAFFECGKCGHNFIFPALEGAELANAYEGYYTQNSKMMSLKYFMGDQRFEKFKFYYAAYFEKRKITRLFAFIAERIPGLGFMLRRAVRFVPMPRISGKKLLDVGCGNGQFLLRAKDIGYEVEGLDFDKKTVEVARALGLNIKFGNIDDISHIGYYDVITLSHVIEHVHNPEDLLIKIYRLLKVGGYFYIATPNFGSAGRKTFGKFWRGFEFPRHLHIFNINELKDVLSKVGFSRIEVIYDLPQSVGILKTSFKIYNDQSNTDLAGMARITAKLLFHNPFEKKSLDVIAIRCWK